MSRHLETSLNNKEFVLNSLEKGLRLDGRQLSDFRSLEIQFGKEYGQVDVSFGHTRYIFLFF